MQTVGCYSFVTVLTCMTYLDTRRSSFALKSYRQLPTHFMSVKKKIMALTWQSGLLVTFPCLALSPCTPLLSVSLLAFCTFATCSFSRLFSSSSSLPAMKKVEPQSNVKYNAPGSLVKRSSTFSQFPTEKSKTFDFLSDE